MQSQAKVEQRDGVQLMRINGHMMMGPTNCIQIVFTPKALHLEELRRQGKTFDEALEIVDREYSSDGMKFGELKAKPKWMQANA